MGKIIVLIFIIVLGGLIYKLIKPLLYKEESVNNTDKAPKSFAEIKEELEFKIAFYKKKVGDGYKEAAEKLAHYEKELEEINIYQKSKK